MRHYGRCLVPPLGIGYPLAQGGICLGAHIAMTSHE